MGETGQSLHFILRIRILCGWTLLEVNGVTTTPVILAAYLAAAQGRG